MAVFENSYTISSSAASSVNEYLAATSFTKLVVLVDENTVHNCLPLLNIGEQNVIEISSGELNKTLRTCELIWKQMTDLGLDRNALMINLGGGVIGDMGGFCASTYKRGIRFINVPTTLLSQVDASVGGKLGIDFNGLKNHIGVFNTPETVIIAPEFLNTLDPKEIRSGFAEILKHGLIADATHFNEAKDKGPQTTDWGSLIKRSVEIKEQIVARDPKEAGERKLLNFGHTIGHAIETFYLGSGNHLLHGEAIAIGMFCEAYLSYTKGMLAKDKLDSILSTLISFYNKASTMIAVDLEATELMYQDKKNKGNRILATLLTDIGSAEWDVNLEVEEAKQAIEFYNRYQA